MFHVVKKLINNRWMTIFLLIGFILVVALISSIPLYTNGILKKMLVGDMERYQIDTNKYAGFYNIKLNLQYFEKDDILGSYTNLKRNIYSNLLPEIPLSVFSDSEEIFIEYYQSVPFIQREEDPDIRLINLKTRPNMTPHIDIIHGRIFSSQIEGETVEIIVSERFLHENSYYLDEVIKIDTENDEPFNKMRIVGVFDIKNYQDTYWQEIPGTEDVFIDHSIFVNEFLNKGKALIREVIWSFALDYHGISISDLNSLITIFSKHEDMALQYRTSLKIIFAAKEILEDYLIREQQLRTTLWIIETPVLILLFFYILMITNLIIRNEQNEIGVLKSRGKSTKQIFFIYLQQSIIISVIAFILGIPLGYLICTIMGASNGFLEFVRRTPLELTNSFSVYLYSFIALLLLTSMMLLPVYFSIRRSIVQVKQKKARDYRSSFYKKYFIDIILILISGYGYYRYYTQQDVLEMTRISGSKMGIDPVLFLTSTLFIIGLGLLFLRVFPFIIRLIFNSGKRFWPATMYCALIQVGRTGKQGQFLMLYLIFSIAIGIFDANMARTLNRNIEDRTRYEIGADITLRQKWINSDDIDPGADDSDDREPGFIPSNVIYIEPSFTPFTQLPGVDSATKVYSNSNGLASIDGSIISNIKIQGIIPHEFGEIAWFRNDLLPYHWYNYLNLLSENQNAFLVSTNLQKLEDLQIGDSIAISWGNQEYLSGIIYGFVDYWPTFNPFENPDKTSYLVVANLSYLHNKLAKLPYDVWINKEKATTDEQVYNGLEEKEIELVSLTSSSQELIKQKNDPLLKGINGTLTQGFIFIMLICAIGFLIYWVLSLRSRTLQFGILRAIGLSQKNVILVIIIEQIMISGAAIIAGIFIGGLASSLFVPFLQLVFSAAEQVPPFQVLAVRSDYLKIYIIIFAMCILGLIFLMFFIKRLKIDSALKLGED